MSTSSASKLEAHLKEEVEHVRSITSSEYLSALSEDDDDPREFFDVVQINNPTRAKVAFKTTPAEAEESQVEIITDPTCIDEWHVDVLLRAPKETPYKRNAPYMVRFAFSPGYIPTVSDDGSSSTTFKSPRMNFLCVLLHESIDQDTGELRALRDGVDLVEGLALVTQVFRGATHPCDTCNANYKQLGEEQVKREDTINAFRQKFISTAAPDANLFTNIHAGGVLWKNDLFHPHIREVITERQKQKDPHTTISTDAFKQIVKQLDDDVFSFPLLSEEACDTLMSGIDEFSSWGFKAERPNSMNRYGLVVNNIGLEEAVSELITRILEPIGAELFGKSHGFVSLERNHSFVVKYAVGQDTGLDMHIDDSDVTFNIALTDTFEGGDLKFCGRFGESDHRQWKGQYEHRKGHCVIHLGVHRHGAMDVETGSRCNLIVWGRCLPARRAGVHRTARDQFEKESGPPSVQCVSRVHDRDYYAVKQDEKESEQDSDTVGGRLEACGHKHGHGHGHGHEHKVTDRNAWCPPAAAEYNEFPPNC